MDVQNRRIAILGAGPIGLEAALYARKLGFSVRVYERGRVGENLRQFAHVRLFSPFGMNVSSLGATAVGEASRTKTATLMSGVNDLLVSGEFVERYLQPLAGSPALAPCIRENTWVVAVGREGLLKADEVGGSERSRRPFRILLRAADGREYSDTADVVIDATGVFGNPNWLGFGGIPAEGERGLADAIEHGLPDIRKEARADFAGRTTLVVGAGYSAATNVVALSELAEDTPKTRVIWLTRRPENSSETGPLPRIPGDRLPERDRIAARANALATAGRPPVEHHAGFSVTRVGRAAHQSNGEYRIAAFNPQSGDSREFQVGRVLANVGFRPDNSIYRELQVHECYATAGPMKLAAALLGKSSADCLDQISAGPEALRTSEPNFYILGAKSYGRNSKFLISLGLEQVRDVFKLITEVGSLDLYQ